MGHPCGLWHDLRQKPAAIGVFDHIGAQFGGHDGDVFGARLWQASPQRLGAGLLACGGHIGALCDLKPFEHDAPSRFLSQARAAKRMRVP